DFGDYLQQLMAATAALSERLLDSALPALRESFRSAVADFKDYLTALNGAPVHTAQQNLLKFTDHVYKIPDGEVDRVFGFAGIGAQYPYQADANANELVAEISKRIGSQTHTAAEVMNHQRAGLTGATAIDAVLGPAPGNDAEIDRVANQVYRWLVALRSLGVQP